MEHFNTKIVAEIISRTPNKKRPVNYLIELLSLGKESAYRRIKNQIPFTFEEVAIIAKDLDLSIDQLLEYKTNNHFSFGSEFSINQEPLEIYTNMFEYDNVIMEKLIASTDMKITATINRIPLRFFPFETLFKLEYCHYLYSTGYISLMTRFSDLTIPPQLIELQKKSASYFSKMRNITCIVDSIVFTKLLREIEYYIHLKFISLEDLYAIQTELFGLIEMSESLLRTGKNNVGSDYVIYYSLLNLESNIIFFEYNENSLLQIWVYPETPIVIKDNYLIHDIHKRWFDSKIRNSMLASKTNDTQLIDTLREIYKKISNLTKIED